MIETKVAHRYAKAVLDLAAKQNVVDQVYQDLKEFSRILAENYALRQLLKSPIILTYKKQNVLNQIFASEFNKLTWSFFEIILRKHRENQLEGIALSFIDQYHFEKGFIDAVITTPVPLSEKLRASFTDMVQKKTGKKPLLKEKVNPALIGGYILRIGDLQFDESVKSKLNTVKTTLSDSTYTSKF